MTIEAFINGHRRELTDGTSVYDLVCEVTATTPPPTGVAVALDGEVLPRADWQHAVAADAQLEILTAVQGG